MAVDASALGRRFVVLCVAVVYRGGALPVAWAVLPANVRGSWKRPWLRLLRRFRDALPGRWSVVVLADRGLYAKWLFQAIQKLDWHPFMRINTRGSFRPDGEKQRRPLLSFVPAALVIMTSFTRIVIVFHLLRQALGTQEMPSNQILIGLTLFLTTIRPLAPDVLVVRLGNNDHSLIRGHESPPLATDAEYTALRDLPAWSLHLEVVRLAFHAYRRWLATKPWATTGRQVPLDRYERNLRRLVADAHTGGTRVLFLDFPYRELSRGLSPG